MVNFNFNNFAEVVEDTKQRIDDLKNIVDVLHTEFQGASDITPAGLKYRSNQLDQLMELNDTVRNIAIQHPAQHVYGVMQQADDVMSTIVEQETNKSPDLFRAQWGTPVNRS